MKFKNSLKTKIWQYLIVFSIMILLLIWFLNVFSLNKFYEQHKKKQLINVTETIVQHFDRNNPPNLLDNLLDDISFNNDFCIEVYQNNKAVYISNNYGRGCLGDGNPLEINTYKKAFMNGGIITENYEFINPKYSNKTLMSGLKIENYYIFITTSLDPIDSTIQVIENQFGFILFAVLILSFLIAYFISNRISKPIEKINLAAQKMAKGDFDVVFETSGNISEINELTSTLNYTKNELSKTELLRQELLANVSHDLKTPLTMIRAYAEMVRDLTYKDIKKRTDNLNTIIEETDRLNLLVNDILELSKLQSDYFSLNYEEFDIHKLIRTILKHYDIYVQKDGYQIIYENKKAYYITADKRKIEQVLYNLINNALNYTGNDKKIIINLVNLQDKIRIEITDTGKGIEKEELPYIWDKYYKIDKTYSRLQIGSGIGLSIVKGILELHQFNYGVNSIKDKGTTFYMEFPLKEKFND